MPLAPEIAEMLAVVKAANLPPMYTMEPAEVRAANRVPVIDNPIPLHSVVNRKIPGPEIEIPLRIYTPNGEGPFPVSYTHLTLPTNREV